MTNKKYNFDLIIILGATATGKTSLAVKLAEKLNGEIISADSRQIYKKMDIGTGKDYKEYIINNKKIPYHLIDILDPNVDYSVYQFQKDFKKSYEQIKSKNKIPILCGGTGLYIESILLNYPLIDSSPDYDLRKKMELKPIKELLEIAGEKFKKTSNESEIHNKRRIIRYIEKLNQSNKAPKQIIKINSPLILGTNFPRDEIRAKIETRLLTRLDEGLINEVEKLINDGISHERLEKIGLEYKFISYYLKKELTKEELIKNLTIAIQQFAKRQLSWFRRMERRSLQINWIQNSNINIAIDLINTYKN